MQDPDLLSPAPHVSCPPPEWQDLRHPPFTLRELLARAKLQHAREGNFAWLAEDPCVYCGRHGRAMSREHLIPQSKLSDAKRRALGLAKDFGRGHRGWENLAPACRECNTARGSGRWVAWLIREADRLGPSSYHPFRPGYVAMTAPPLRHGRWSTGTGSRTGSGTGST